MMSRSVVVQRPHPRQRALHLALRVLLLVTALVAGFLAGGFGSLKLSLESSTENRSLREAVVAQARELEELRQWKIDNETRREIDAAALELVRQELAAQQDTIAEQEKAIRFYKNLMSPGELGEGLNIRSVDLRALENDRHYQFRILVQQSVRRHDLLIGTLSVQVLGTNGEEEVVYDLTDISEQVPGPQIRLRFKYFQAIDGEIELPEGFVPQAIRTVARSDKPRKAEVKKDFPWVLQEKLSHVGD